MISYSGKVMRQFTRLSTSRMQFGSAATNIKNEKSTNLSTSLHKTDGEKQSKYLPYSHPQHCPPVASSSSTVLIKPAVSPSAPETEKLRLKRERERLSQIRNENNARFKDYLATLPQLDYPKHYKVECVANLEDANRKLAQLVGKQTHSVFGVDLEWPPCFVKGQSENKVTLVQICSQDKILLIQLPRIQGGFPPELRRFFEDKNILKCGVNIAADGLKLQRDFGFVTNGLVELRDLAEMAKSPKLGISHLRSLRALTGIFLEQNMAKGKVRLSNWGKPNLTPLQIRYAALDAYASYELYMVLEKLKDTAQKLPVRHLIDEVPNTVKVAKKEVKKESNISLKNNATKLKSTYGPTSTVTIIKKKQ
ncbi:ribonuclease H-like domain-containing protein [Thamnidium elegans]|nr:ribonuclease H-like domain-containing protein [Thamnidium elegans]